MNKNIILLLIYFFIAGCSNSFNEDEIVRHEKNSHFVFDNSEKQFMSDLGDQWSTEMIVIGKDLTYKIGSSFDGYHLVDSLLLISDRTASEISIVNRGGELVSSLTHPSPGLDRYSSIGTIDVRQGSKELVVFDYERQKFDYFSKSGEYLMSQPSPMPFWDYGVLKSGAIIYSVENADVSEYKGGKTDYFQFYIDGDNKRFSNRIENLSTLYTIPIQDFGQFANVHDLLQFRSPLSDTIFLLDGEGNCTEKASFEFTYLNEFRLVSNNQDIMNKADYLYDRKIPWPQMVLFDPRNEGAFCILWEGGRRFFLQIKNGQQVNKPSSLYNIGGVICKAPRFYEDDVFFQQMYKYEYDYFQTLLNKDDVSREDVISDLGELRDEYADESDIVIIMSRYNPD